MRFIGLQHRRKKTAQGEARPTMVAIHERGKPLRMIKLEDEQAELDFVKGVFPLRMREATTEDNPADFQAHQLVWKNLSGDESVPEGIPEFQIRDIGKQKKRLQYLSKVPAEFDGLCEGDNVAAISGGSGMRLLCAMTNRGNRIGATVFTIAPATLLEVRPNYDKSADAGVLAELLAAELEGGRNQLFHILLPRHADILRICVLWEQRMLDQHERIKCSLRLQARVVGSIFLSEDGEFPAGSIAAAREAMLANDELYQRLRASEKRTDSSLLAALEKSPLYREVFKPIEGLGPAIAARIISEVLDIRRFPNVDKFVRYIGVHVDNGRFARYRRGQTGTAWKGQARQALYLLMDQANKRPKSSLGIELREIKQKMRALHPEVIIADGKKRYSDSHIHKMACWRLITRVARRIYSDWKKFEEQQAQKTAA